MSRQRQAVVVQSDHEDRTEPHWLLLAPGVWVFLGLSILVAIVLRYSLLGRYIYAIGSNEATARLCGINVPVIKVMVYTIGGLATGLAGVLQFASLGAMGDPTTAGGLELQVIAAVVIGGGSLSGGEGTVMGTLIGCLIMQVLKNGCVHAGYSQSQPGHHHRHHHRRRGDARPAAEEPISLIRHSTPCLRPSKNARRTQRAMRWYRRVPTHLLSDQVRRSKECRDHLRRLPEGSPFRIVQRNGGAP